MATVDTAKLVEQASEYKYGFSTNIEQEFAPKGLNEDTVKFISNKKKEPVWLLEWRLKAYNSWKDRKDGSPVWANLKYQDIDYQDIHYFAAPKSDKDKPKSLDEVDPELLRAYDKLGIPLKEQEFLAGIKNSHKVAVDAVFDSVSVATTFKKELSKLGIIFCSFSEAVENHPEIVKKYLGSVVPVNDNYFSNLNSAVFSDGSFVYIPPNVKCPMELSTYFRINAE
ncbi:MAG: Fe-S cluster assembly protein SufB, partial [SAR324 cluster bacterium]|nr:Fe-S cluster assembly protein SufB [SAR324 cluster bacterium]